MTGVVETGQPAIVVTDASVLINFLRVDRMDLISECSHDFVVTDHVAEEITSRYPDQRQRFALAIDDRRAKSLAQRTSQALQILTTQDLVEWMIAENLLDITEADGIKNEWAMRHRFRLKIQSFQEVICQEGNFLKKGDFVKNIGCRDRFNHT